MMMFVVGPCLLKQSTTTKMARFFTPQKYDAMATPAVAVESKPSLMMVLRDCSWNSFKTKKKVEDTHLLPHCFGPTIQQGTGVFRVVFTGYRRPTVKQKHER